MSPQTHVLDLRGDFGCFTSPEAKVERFSLPCPTPSAARGIFDAIFCHRQEFRWQIDAIEIIEKPEYIYLRRSEVKEKASTAAIEKRLRGGGELPFLKADATSDEVGTDKRGRTQRQTAALRQPRFRIHGHIVPWPGFEFKQGGFDQQFARRARRGQCFHQPCLGMREMICYFRYVDDLASEPLAADYDHDLGLMVYDTFNLSQQNDRLTLPFISLFAATIRGGVLRVPPFEDPCVLKPADGQEAC